MNPKIFPLLVFAASAAAAAEQFAMQCPASLCPGGGAICGRGVGKSEAEADRNANGDIAAGINSSLEGETDYAFASAEENGALSDASAFSSREKTRFNLPNMHDTKLIGYSDENGSIASSRYICRSDAAKPYLASLRELRSGLSYSRNKITPESCRAMDNAYSRIGRIEGILESLGQMDAALKKECEAEYARIKKDCAGASKGVYVESNSKELKSKVSAFITKNNECVLAESPESAAMVLKMDYEDCEKRDMQYRQFSCKACAEVALRSAKTGKSLYENIVSHKEVWTGSMKAACSKAIEPIPNKIWEEIKSKISKGECK